MAEHSVFITMVAHTIPLRQAAGSTLYWDGRSDACRDLGSNTVSGHEQQSSSQAKGPLVTAGRVQRQWTTSEICLVPMLTLQAIAGKQEAALVQTQRRQGCRVYTTNHAAAQLSIAHAVLASREE